MSTFVDQKIVVQEHLDVTTKIGCPVQCKTFCPQDVLVKNYKSKKIYLSPNDFDLLLKQVPPTILISFSGFGEPFSNPNLIELVDVAYTQGHQIAFDSTLFGATREQIQKLLTYPIYYFQLHLPDGKHMVIPLTDEYKDNVFSVLQGIPNLFITIMNNYFVSNNRENTSRGIFSKTVRYGFCRKFRHPQFVLLPNGDVILCCMDYTLQAKVGNLFEESYNKIRKRYLKNPRKFSICKHCFVNQNIFEYAANKTYTIVRNLVHQVPQGGIG